MIKRCNFATAMKLIVLLSRIPYPLEKGDKLRAFYLMKELAKYHEINLIALSEKSSDSSAEMVLSEFCQSVHFIKVGKIARFWGVLLALFKSIPLQCGYFFNKSAHKKINALINDINPDHIVCQMVRMVEYVKLCPIPKTLDFQDVLSKGMQRRAKTASVFLKPFFLLEYKRLKRYEEDCFSYFNHLSIITSVDQSLISHPNSQNIVVVANGVDFDKYQYRNESKEIDLIFSGNMSYPPNVDAAECLAKQIFPKLLEEFPNLVLTIAGTTPTFKVKALASDNIHITGWVDSMADYYAKSRIFVAPMHLGTGLQNKLIEAMAMKLPCVTSPLAGKPLENCVIGSDIIVCETIPDFVNAIKTLLTDKVEYNKFAENGYRYVTEHYNWEAMGKKFSELISAK